MPTLIKCSACNRDISSEAATCPHCGQPQASRPQPGAINPADPVHKVGIAIAVLILVVFVGGLIVTLINR